MKSPARHSFNHRRCTACDELTIKPSQRFLGGWFFIRCPNCRRRRRDGCHRVRGHASLNTEFA